MFTNKENFGTSKKCSNNRHLNFLVWSPSPGNEVDLNCDGARSTSTSLAVCGCLLRNKMGDFFGGFVCNLGRSSFIRSELWVVFHGIQLAKECRFV